MPQTLSTATLLEARIVVERQLGPAGQAELDLLLSRAAITAVPLEELHVHWALAGWRRYGKGRHPAGLNLGDCFSYEPGQGPGRPLLFRRTTTLAPQTLTPPWLPKIAPLLAPHGPMTQLETRTEPMVVNFGPHHPSMHGVLRLVVTLDGEDVVDCEPVIGYLHRGMEKIAENRTNVMFVPYVSRMDYAAGMFYEAIVVNAPERLADVPVPKRASYIRVLMLELNRIANHLLWLGPFLADVGAQTPFFYIFRERGDDLRPLGSGHRPAADQQQLLPHRRCGSRSALRLAGEVSRLLRLVWPQNR